MKKTLLILCSALLLWACTKTSDAPLLKGNVQLEGDTEFAVNYLPEGNIYLAQVMYITVDSLTGDYEFNMDLPDGTADVDIFVGDQLYGAHLEKGKTVVLNITQTDGGEYDCSFSGDNADVSEAVSAAAIAYDLFSLQDMSYAEAQALADSRHQTALQKAAAISDATLRDYYTRLFGARYTGMCLRLLGDRAAEENCKETDFPEYAKLIATIDPNSELDYRAMNSILWLMAQPKAKPEFKGDYSGFCTELMNITDSCITLPQLRKMMAYSIPQTFFGYGDHETGKEEFWARYKEFAKDYPEYIEAFTSEYEKVVQDMDGKQVPELQLQRPDGTTVSITSLQGKYTYIDVWATWCGPCCKEIPFVEKLVEEMKDNDQLQFVSFSVDSDRDAWLKKLEKDQPAWPQFLLDADANKTLSDALSITGIPRFFVLGPDGTIINQDAKRPSDPELVDYLKALTGK